MWMWAVVEAVDTNDARDARDARERVDGGDLAHALHVRSTHTLTNQRISYASDGDGGDGNGDGDGGVGNVGPLQVSCAYEHYIVDHADRCFVDLINNVAHVGHANACVIDAAQEQWRCINTNTRYVYDSLTAYVTRLVALFPPELSVCVLVNSGSEANDLALRMALAHTRARDVICLDHAYHGHTQATIDVSPYKFNSRGGAGKPDHVHVAPIPDLYRGQLHVQPNDVQPYIDAFDRIVEDLVARTRPPAAFIHESILSCGGQIFLPPGYLRRVYERVRRAGGVCIADEVQVGLGRVGSHMWAFQSHDVVPDIVTLGKPLGNGFPLAAVLTTPAVARSFDNGMEYFNTFGGSSVSCAVGLAVLDELQRRDLMANAASIGAYLHERMQGLREKHPIVGDVRGQGLFYGIELVRDRTTREPAGIEAEWVAKQLRSCVVRLFASSSSSSSSSASSSASASASSSSPPTLVHGFLVGTDGPHHNVLKLKPPMTIGRVDIDAFACALDHVLVRAASTSFVAQS